MSDDGRQLDAAVDNSPGLATIVVRALDAAGILVDNIEVRPPSLDDVFFSLTGHTATIDPDLDCGRARPHSRRSNPVTTAVVVPLARGAPSRPAGRLTDRLADVWALTRRNLIHVSREPMQLSDVTVQPVLFTLLFIYVFGSGIPIAGGSYKDFALAGLLTLNLTTSTMGTAVGLSTDLHEGVIDRFRTLPMWRAADAGRPVDLRPDVRHGLRDHRGPDRSGHRLAGRRQHPLGHRRFRHRAVLQLLAVVGLGVLRPEQQGAGVGPVVGLHLLVPAGLHLQRPGADRRACPGWLQAIADWNPVSAVTAAARHLFGNPNPSALNPAWPMQHPVEAALLWSIAILVVCAPLAVHFFKVRTAE